MWQADTDSIDDDPPRVWVAAADDAGILDVELLIQADPARLSLTANDHTEHYTPSTAAISTCP